MCTEFHCLALSELWFQRGVESTGGVELDGRIMWLNVQACCISHIVYQYPSHS